MIMDETKDINNQKSLPDQAKIDKQIAKIYDCLAMPLHSPISLDVFVRTLALMW